MFPTNDGPAGSRPISVVPIRVEDLPDEGDSPISTSPVTNNPPNQQTKKQSILPRHTQSHPNELERKKNEIVSEMLNKLKPFVTAQGVLRLDANFEEYAKLMRSEQNNFVQRTLLLTVLIGAGGSNKEAILTSMCKCTELLRVLSEWLGETVKKDVGGGGPILIKLLDLLLLLPLSVEQLVELKLGKIIKKLASSSSSFETSSTCTLSAETRSKAEALFQSWTLLARSEDAKRSAERVGGKRTFSSSVDGDGNKSRRMSESASVGVVENHSLFSKEGSSSPPPPPVKTRAEQILERVARGETAKVVNRPMSADDIHREKRRQQYLAQASQSIKSEGEDASNVQSNNEVIEEEEDQEEIVSGEESNLVRSTASLPVERKKSIEEYLEKGKVKASKRVTFAEDNELVKIYYYEGAGEDYYKIQDNSSFNNNGDTTRRRSSTSKQKSYLEKDEARYAFKEYYQEENEMEPEIAWRTPSRLSLEMEQDSRSEEGRIQEERERTALSAVYYSLDDVPPSPSEHLIMKYSSQSEQQYGNIKVIPLKDVDNKVPIVKRIVGASGRSSSEKISTSNNSALPPPDIFNLLNSNPNVLQDLLKSIPPPPAPTQPIVHGLPPSMIHRPPPPHPSMPFPFPFPGMQQHTPMGPFPFVPPVHGTFPIPTPPLPPPPQSFPMNPPHVRGPVNNNNNNVRKKPCKFYRAGIPTSCRFGPLCTFLHND